MCNIPKFNMHNKLIYVATQYQCRTDPNHIIGIYSSESKAKKETKELLYVTITPIIMDKSI
jgi:hypothetical protein